MTAKEFELHTKQFLEKRLKQSKTKTVVHHDKVLISPSGNKHQIDLHYEFMVAGAKYLTIIECKLWSSPVKKEKVAALNAVKDDLKAQKAILITNAGFQQGAITFAKSNCMGLIRLTEQGIAEDIAHFDGGLNEISEIIAHEPAATYYTNRFEGLFYPDEMSLWRYLIIKYGKDVTEFIVQQLQDPSNLDDPGFKPPKHIADALKAIPNNWYEEYELVESCGLGMMLANSQEVRVVNHMIYILKNLLNSRG